ncbi:DUF3040 domain-containing protein [Prauserella muralis]|uniref:Uncharacterized protein n=1 Tax=Prauserella muralis TaxID=588067 RepID=A0A2V4BB38_9PSEU|nr:DUF3040 domain-containing protein [Prauserella muralis]PXY26939.1 hypothetical protein BAY60_10570 [Prauserella muralis]TWE23449.1 DUF3040 family protein [Prauserella muralis]
MLSHHERQELERIQHWFELDDPDLAQALGQGTTPSAARGRGRISRFAIDALAAVVIVLGIVTLNFGLLFLGALVLAVAACLHVSGWPSSERGERRGLAE